MKYFVYSVIGIVAAAIVVGFFIVDSPAESRMRKFDEQRINNLSFIQSEILNFWTRKGELPKTLSSLKDNIRGFSVPTDPESGEAYFYEARGKYEFSLCADFARESYELYFGKPKPVPMRPMEFGGYLQDDWQHSVGRACFLRTIDPELYPVNKSEPKR